MSFDVSVLQGGSQTFEVPIAETDLAAVFRQMEAHRKKLGIIDFGCSNMCADTSCCP